MNPDAPPELPWPADDETSSAPFSDVALQYVNNYTHVLNVSSFLDAADNVSVDASPASNDGSLGVNPVRGTNPATSKPYDKQPVLRADLYRATTEFWAEGPARETVPGVWNMILNSLSTSTAFERRWNGQGLPLEQTEWDVKAYLALNAALHDAAVAAWGAKAYFETARPMTFIRYLAWKGQRSEPSLPSYNRYGLPLVPNLIELVSNATIQPGERHAHLNASIGRVAVRAWRGLATSNTTASGVGWVLGEDWWPYWKPNFINPTFAAYMSAHSAFCTAASTVMAIVTGNDYFPGGLGRWAVPQHSFKLDVGPTAPLELQWATFSDAAGQCGVARVVGGNHALLDNAAAIKMGATIGQKAYSESMKYFHMDAMSQTEVIMSILVLVFMFAGALIGTSYGVYKLRPQFATTTIDLIRDLRRRITPGAEADGGLQLSDLQDNNNDTLPQMRKSGTSRNSFQANRNSISREREAYVAGQSSIPLDQIELDSSYGGQTPQTVHRLDDSAPARQAQQEDELEFL